jgi:hypothetical protein
VTIRLEAEGLQNRFQIAQETLRLTIRGPVLAELTKRAIRVQNKAKWYASGNGAGPHVKSSRLRNSIAYWPSTDSRDPYVDIGSNVIYAPYVELGHRNRAHAYALYTTGGKFTGTFGYVSNRPTRPYPFLRPALEAARTT